VSLRRCRRDLDDEDDLPISRRLPQNAKAEAEEYALIFCHRVARATLTSLSPQRKHHRLLEEALHDQVVMAGVIDSLHPALVICYTSVL
jgi:hypothetical protein